ncbi:Lipocalin family protein [Psychromonas ingrahamii 37]|uniref:Outer membrane lipoprotein Blc n=1 Tax=Psychromonas ingrahamii (strain DSM 17664 / CCUG 51855 / 37) TaxID=357804 RepID=A1T0H4_PSYIN|nr:lipocalin family protein [Psychromonas ingrahamii]ABM05239.1 Lipocalin family protein [Psychromonas ingrahamii 37]
MRIILIAVIAFLQFGCTGVAKDIKPVEGLQTEKYLGLWYEIARLDHSFERGMSNVKAEYSLREDGGIKVLNSGYSSEEKEWTTAEGKAYFVDEKNKGHLKVSFFGPFYGSYVIFKLDKINYQYAYVTSYSKDYLWLLARTATVTEAVKQDFIKTAKINGFATDQLIFVDQQSVLNEAEKGGITKE